MALLSDTNPDPDPQSTLCCDSTVGAYKHSDPEKKGKKESFFKLVEWSEQLRLVTSVRLSAIRRRVQIRLCTEQRV